MKTALLLIGHGSRIDGANATLHAIAEMIRNLAEFDLVEVSFLSRDTAEIQEKIDACVQQGAQCILLYPYFLSAGTHVLNDLPSLLDDAARRHPDVKLTLAEPLGAHPKLAEIVCERAREKMVKAGWI
ncbi:sirohydrochlorin chelatase [Geoalkalibacter subterraneus]|jgi:sirohydrochlorin ferrochelatase|uniref:Sirohydrochlorin cobaltochelatase n=1 Tax=Geoalkalibacter subterraneus TaxID=483547 RepID=A0A0B5FH04_9BACT|nr:CbiX/SirB N-terminal domain-containing protein [Geoalkalibacter subterraneus]AJF07432.1 sirohydrochlorin cobaltochelatase [Geoalkalibacter subterraneus]